MSKISVVVPVYYNAESLERLYARLAAMASTTGQHFEFLFVDDRSGDASFELLAALATEDRRVRVIRLSRNFGSNAAILAGLGRAIGDCVVVLSADLQDPPEVIPDLLAQWTKGCEVVLATRRRRVDPLLARWSAQAFNRLFRALVFADFPSGGFDFMALDRRVVEILVRLDEKNSYIFGQVMWVGFKRATVYYDRAGRSHGRSRWTTSKKVKYFIDAFTAFSYLPLRLASLLGFVMAFAGFVYALTVVAQRSPGIPSGWASVVIVLLVTAGVQLLMLGILGEYLWRVLDQSRLRPSFIIDTEVNAPANDGVARPDSRPSQP